MASWLTDIADALDLVHEHHVLHRDVKPGNILFDRPGPGAEPFLADFGIAKALEGEMMVHTHTGEHLGSPKYMPPETWFGTPGPAFDQYSLACVAYEALSGTLPHTADNALALAMEKNAKPARPLTEVAPHVPAAAAAALMRGLEKDPAQRFQSCSELARAFTNGLTAQASAAGAAIAPDAVSARATRPPETRSTAPTPAAERLTLSELQAGPSAARVRWMQTLAITGAICAILLAGSAGSVMDGYGIPFVIGLPICYALVAGAWATRRVRVATLRSLSVGVAAATGLILVAIIPYDARGGLEMIKLGPTTDPNRLPIALPLAVILIGAAFVIGRRQNVAVRDGNALLAIQVPMVGLCLWLAGRLSSRLTPVMMLSGSALVVVAFGVLLVAPRTAVLAEEEIPAARVSRSFVWFSLAAVFFGLAAPLSSALRGVLSELFYAAAVLPLGIFGILQRRSPLSRTARGLAYGCAVVSAGIVGGVFGFMTFFLVGMAVLHLPQTFHLSDQYIRVGLVLFSVVPAGVLAAGMIYLRSPRRPAWHAIAPLVALHLSWLAASALIIPSAFVGALGGFLGAGETGIPMPAYLLVLSAAASTAAVLSARASAGRSADAAPVSPLTISNAGARN